MYEERWRLILLYGLATMELSGFQKWGLTCQRKEIMARYLRNWNTTHPEFDKI